jgi:FkbM family methyltransferase
LGRVFLDVGANTGQSLAAAIEYGGFDQIVCFEPVEMCWAYLKAKANQQTRIEKFGLWDRNTKATVYEPGTKGAGMWLKDKRLATDKPITSQVGEFRRASEWFKANVDTADCIYLKINCEGAECDILDDLLDSGEFDKVDYLMVHFDVVKIKAMSHRAEQTKIRLEQYSFPRVAYCKDVMLGATHGDRIINWLKLCDGTGGRVRS